MASNYWIKLYHEILDDPKMGRLRDSLWRRVIECFLMAGEMQEDGFLPDLDDIAWRLRVSAEILESELGELAEVGILDRRDGRWFVTKFAERQSAMSASERGKRWREMQHKQEYYADVTEDERGANGERTDRSQKKKTEEEKETEEDTEPAVGVVNSAYENEFGSLSPIISEKIIEAVDEHGGQWVMDAMEIAVQNNKRRWSYVAGILENWRVEGRHTSRASPDHDADDAWSVVEEAFDRGNGTLLRDHPRVLAAIDALGGWGQVKQSSSRDIPFVKKRFAQEYANVRV